MGTRHSCFFQAGFLAQVSGAGLYFDGFTLGRCVFNLGLAQSATLAPE